MKKIDYYILREFSTTFLIVSLFFTLISLIVDIFENLNRFIDNQVVHFTQRLENMSFT